ncbi:Flp pilus assembly protein CpaB [Nocardioides sp.]|uniref:Flp pilus assembly protein CpaB n=1 Tax=Nocardioides sp. TaxID=35761 RepID=UPI000C89FF64|nr:Flp pilus assembly protein CpaB [Nocardioides sp.]MAS56597.1 Flp pilus assembly protein CpaB [Pimelobacter sp.]MDE0778872.1 Flp pilus assembly protein CpaB [Nocardioides sp.]
MDRRRILLVVAVIVAALGAGLVFVYAQDAEDRAAEQFTTRNVLVATQMIAPGESASDAAAANKILSKPVPTDEILTNATDDGTLFTDTVALTTIYPGEQLITEKFGSVDEVTATTRLTVPKGMTATAITLDDTSRISGFTPAGTRVGVFISGTFEDSTEPEVRVLFKQVLILANGLVTVAPQLGPDGQPLPSADSAALSQYVLALTARDAAKLKLAQDLGDISLVLLPPDTQLKIGDPVSPGDIFEGN